MVLTPAKIPSPFIALLQMETEDVGDDEEAERRGRSSQAPREAAVKAVLAIHLENAGASVDQPQLRLPLPHGGTRPPKGEINLALGDEACETCHIGDYAELLLLCEACDKVRKGGFPSVFFLRGCTKL